MISQSSSLEPGIHLFERGQSGDSSSAVTVCEIINSADVMSISGETE